MVALNSIQYIVMHYIWSTNKDLVKNIDIINYMKSNYDCKYGKIYYLLSQLEKEGYIEVIYIGANPYCKYLIAKEVYHLSIGI